MEVQEQSYYAVLNVPPDATEDLIRRAYRQLATTYHPDKHTDSHLQQEASRMFTAVQEAYEVLSDPHKRDIYDVYGKEGLRAGLEVGDRVKTRDELRKEWEQFQKTQEKEKLDAQVNYRGVYIFRVDASALVSPYARNLPRTPEITNIYMTSGVDVPVDSKDWGLLSSDQDALHLGGLVNVRKNVGGGSFLAGYRRAFSDYSTFEVQAAAGLKTLLSASSGVQLSQHAHASLTATWQPMSGVGLQLVTTRQLSEAWNGEYSWVVGPPEASGMSLGLNRRSDKMVLSGRVEVGAMTALVARIVRQLNETTTGRLSVKVSPMGVDVDIGSNKRISEVTTAGASITVGMQGVILKVRYSRAGHLFEFPILLSPTPNPRIIAAAYTIIPLLAYIVRDWVVGPVARLIETRKARSIRRQRAEEVREALAHAAAAAAVMAPVARRRLAKEAQQKGLVVALALYGEENAVRQAADDKPWELRAAALASAGTQTADAAATAASLEAMGSPEGGAGAGSSAGSAAGSRAAELQQGQQGGVGGAAASTAGGSSREGTAGAADSGEEGVAGPSGGQLPGVPAQQAQHAQQQGGGGGGGEEDLPPAVADVTTAVQYMVEGSRLVFHRGYSKSGLMGFCDPAPSQAKLLLVYFLHENLPYRAALLDTEGAVLPTRGTLVTDPLEAALVQELAKQQLDRAGPQQQQQQQQQQQRYRTSSAADWIGGEGGGTE